MTTNRCASIFEQVYTVELDQDLTQPATKFLSKRKNVKVIQGDAVNVLPQIFASPGVTDALIFLDGHFSGGVTACGDHPEPAIEELKFLSKVQSQVNCIVIDDFRAFGTELGYPSKSELFRAIEQLFENAKIAVHLDQIVVVPQAMA